MHFKNRNESGRTLLEMLAVLTLMGVLTTLALNGVETATTKANVNNILAEVRKHAITASTGDTHPFAEGLFDKDTSQGTQTPLLVAGHAIGDSAFTGCPVTVSKVSCNDRVYQGNNAWAAVSRTDCIVAYVPVGTCKVTTTNSSGTSSTKTYGKKLTPKICQALFERMPDNVNAGTVIGDIIRLNSKQKSNGVAAACPATIPNQTKIGIRIR